MPRAMNALCPRFRRQSLGKILKVLNPSDSERPIPAISEELVGAGPVDMVNGARGVHTVAPNEKT
jgi:hypothetical protein